MFINNAASGSAVIGANLKYTADGNGTLTLASQQNTPYYPTASSSVKIIAYHPHDASASITDGSYDFTVQTNQSQQANSDESNYYNSDLLYSVAQTYQRQAAAHNLSFKHLLSKVVCTLTKGTGLTESDLTGATVSIVNAQLKGTFKPEDGSFTLITGDGASKSDVTMNSTLTPSSYIAVIPPQTFSQGGKLLEVALTNGGKLYYKVPANADVTFETGKVYRYAITVKPGVHLKLNVRGTNNTLSSTDFGGIVMDNNASIEIKGESKENSSLTVTAGNNGWDGASCVGIGATQNATCGDISISNITLNVTGSTAYGVGGAAIGTSSGSSACGNITICNSNVDATGGNAAAAIGIGGTGWSGTTNTVGDIRISGSTIKTTIAPYRSNIKECGAGIGMCRLSLSTFKCGKIILDCESEEQLTTFTTDWSITESEVQTGYKIGKGYNAGNAVVEFGGVYLKGKDTDGNPSYADGWGSW